MISIRNCHSCGNKVVFNRRERLDNVTTLAPNVQILDGNAVAVWLVQHGTGHELNDVGAVLESTAKLSGVDCQAKSLVCHAADVDVGILLNW